MRDDADLTTDAGDSPARVPGARIRHLDLELLSLHVDGALDPGDRRDAEAHLGACSDCALDFTELRVTVSLLQGLPQYEPRKTFVLGPEYGRAKRRPLPAAQPVPQQPASPYLPPVPSPPATHWYSHLIPSTRTLSIASGVVGVALLVSIAGDAMIKDPVSSQALGVRTTQMATSILPSASSKAPKAAPANAPQPGVTETPAPALQEVDGAPATTAASAAPSPWRIAQIGLAMLLLWLLVSLAGRLWGGRQDALPE